jgi:hypothetical protein
VAPITSAIRRFRHEFEAKITKRSLIPVASESPEHLSLVTDGHGGGDGADDHTTEGKAPSHV